MGAVETITHDQFPKQGDWVGQRVVVVFHYNTDHRIGGVIVRDDMEDPFRAIIELDDGRYVLTSECQFRFPDVRDG